MLIADVVVERAARVDQLKPTILAADSPEQARIRSARRGLGPL